MTLRERLRLLAAGVQRRRLVAGLLLLLLALVGGLTAALAYVAPRSPGERVGLSDLQAQAVRRGITTATFRDEDARIVAETTDGRMLWTAYPSNGALTSGLEQVLRAGGADVVVDQQPGVAQVRFLAQFVLPVLLLADLFALLLSATRGGGGAVAGVVDFGTIGTGQAGAVPVRFADVGGAGEAVAELAEVRDYLAEPERYRRLGAAPPKGVLLFGPPGTGKTLLAKAVAGEAGVPFFSVAGAQFVESLVGVGAARVRDLFARVRAVAPAIVFIDELDAVGRRRGSGAATGGTDERENTLNQLLVEMDGFDVSAGIVVVAATNRPDILDPALTRPGRFDRHVTVERPDVHGRLDILAIHARGKPLAGDVDLADVAHRTPGFTGADLANVLNEAALLTARAGAPEITQARLVESIDRVLAGPRRRGRLLTGDELRQIASHEAGHAVVAAATGTAATVHRVTVLPRGRTLGTTTLADADDEVRTSAALRARLAVLVAGGAAERLLRGDVSTAGEHDLAEATGLARDMVARYGMSDGAGPVRWAAGPASSDDAVGLDQVAPATHAAIDAEIGRLLVAARTDADRLLRANAGVLQELVDRLVADETVDGPALAALLGRVRPPGRAGRMSTKPRAGRM